MAQTNPPSIGESIYIPRTGKTYSSPPQDIMFGPSNDLGCHARSIIAGSAGIIACTLTDGTTVDIQVASGQQYWLTIASIQHSSTTCTQFTALA